MSFFDRGIGYDLWQVGSHFSRIFNFCMGGSAEETFSFRVAKGEGECGVCSFCCRVLDWFDKGHCQDSVAWWVGNGVNYTKEHRPIWPWLVIWSGAIAVLWFRPFGLF